MRTGPKMKVAPPSVRLYTLLLDALRLRSALPGGNRRRQRFRSGDRPSEEAVDGMIRELAKELCAERTIGIAIPEKHVNSIAESLTRLLAIVDHLPPAACLEACFDELAFRFAAWCLLHDETPPATAPAWIRGEADKFLENLFSSRGIDRKALYAARADNVGHGAPSRRVLDGLLAGGAPETDELLTSVVRLLRRDKGQGPTFEADCGFVRAHYAVRTLYEALVERLGRESVLPIVERVLLEANWVIRIYRVASQQQHLAIAQSPRPYYTELLVYGARVRHPLWFRSFASSVPDEHVSDRLTKIHDRNFLQTMTIGPARDIAMLERKLGPTSGTSAALATRALTSLCVDMEADRDPNGPYAALRRGNYPEAVCRFRLEIERGLVDVEHYVMLAYALQQSGDTAAGITALLGAPARIRTEAYVRLQLARLLVSADQHESAIAELRAAKRDATETSNIAAIHELLAIAYMALSRPGLARRHAAEAARLGRPLVRTLLVRAPEAFE